MKNLGLLLLTVFATLFLGASFGNREQVTFQQNQSEFDSFKIRTNGVYSLYDTLKGSSGIENYELYEFSSPILFSNDGRFLQSHYCVWPIPEFVESLKKYDTRLDHGKYYLNDQEISLVGTFTFFARGMDWRYYQAKYVGYFDTTGDTLFLKLAEPYPPIKMEFNKNLAKWIESGDYQKYVFKPLPAGDAEKIDTNFFQNVISRNLR